MKRSGAVAVAALAAMVLTTSVADAHKRKLDSQVQAVEIGAGVVSTVTYGSIIGWSWNKHSNAYNWGVGAAVTGGCIVLSPMVATAILKRPLTDREVASMTGSCIVPIVGGWLFESIYDSMQPKPVAMSAKRKKKM
ncbi:MAG: hypothetical protein JO237_08510 [Pseudolabrys sp.]|nr:hypothetical protein [Pseudolabrys sp.]